MKFCLTLNTLLEELHLLKHPFYQSWNEGTLTLDTLKIYAKEYYHHVAAFPVILVKFILCVLIFQIGRFYWRI